MTYLIEYLGEFEFIFEIVLGYVSGDQMGSFEAKKRSRKSHAWAPLNCDRFLSFASAHNSLTIRDLATSVLSESYLQQVYFCGSRHKKKLAMSDYNFATLCTLV